MVKSRKGDLPTYNRSIDVLLLCTANQCRSPMAAALLQHHLAPSVSDVRVTSAGLYPGGRPATPHACAVMAARGLDLTDHRSHRLDRTMLDGIDLVIAMTREHVREVTVIDRAALARTFTLRELARTAQGAGRRGIDESMGDWLARVGEGRQPEALVGIGYDDAYDIADPVGRGRADYEDTADELDNLLGVVASLAWPAVAATQQERRR